MTATAPAVPMDRVEQYVMSIDLYDVNPVPLTEPALTTQVTRTVPPAA